MELNTFALIFLLMYLLISDSRVACARVKSDQCINEGGICVKSQTDCPGWIETYDLSCGHNVCCKPRPSTANPEPIHPNTDICGRITRLTTPNPMLRVVGGDPALEGAWPWQVALVDLSGDIFCGGTLVTPEFVVTAAHCFVSYTEVDIEVILGEHHLVYQTGNEIRRRAKVIVKHTGYSATNNADDIAFVQLDAPVDISGHYIRTACLPDQNQHWTATDKCYVSGWGYTKSIDRDDRHLQHLRVNLVSNTECSASWGIHANITQNHICAGTGATGTCKGDSGGPLVCLRNDTYYLVGITSFGHYTCMRDGFPDVYTSVIKYKDWMTSYMLLLKAIV
ncbi:chymotrypsinogen B-like [Mercenaria mercenaria]|uniref:chymotrypsinogen B-like n=1 Tax=Mercenaria mercenaria TaxID=6596 RepID=UPI00234E9F25|nr:chymotrypsinogen B-like [Mercenaria mercenaria]